MDWLQPIVKNWCALLEKAARHKDREFGKDAKEAMKFFDGPYDFLYSRSSNEGSLFANDVDEPITARPSFMMTYNKVAEAVQLFGPTLYHRNPHREITPARMPPMPVTNPNDPEIQQLAQQMQQAALQQGGRSEMLAWLLDPYLNYTPNELGLRQHSRDAIDETLIKGMGLLWTTTYRPPGSPIQFVGSFYDTVDNLLVDPDMESLEHAKWVARRRVLPTWEVERRFGLKKRTLRGDFESSTRQAVGSVSGDYIDKHRRSETNDLTVYYEIYSRMGIGNRLKDSDTMPGSELAAMDPVLDQFGDHCFLAVTEGYPWPLNLPKESFNKNRREAFMRVQWPTPFWADPAHPWPFTEIAFHRRPRKVWPMSHFKPAMGELKFLNWAFSFMADKIKNTSRDFIAVQKSLGEDIKTAILHGRDLTLLEIEQVHGRTIQDVVSFLQHPNFNGDIYSVVELMLSLLDRRLGLNELMYGESKRQLRSASEAQIKGDQLRIRPDDMAECVETAMTMVARKEALCCRWHLEPQDVAPMLGPERAMLWQQVVANSSVHEVVYELDYRIEAGSIRKPNRQRQQQNANDAAKSWGQLFAEYYKMTGDPAPINALLTSWAKAFDEPPQNYLLKPPPPPQPDPAEQMKLQGEQMKLQGELQKQQMEIEAAEREAQLDAAKAQMDAEVKLLETETKLEADREEAEQELDQDAAEHQQEMEQDRQTFLLDMLQKRQEHALDMELEREKQEAQLEIERKKGETQVQVAKAMARAKPAQSNSSGSKS